MLIILIGILKNEEAAEIIALNGFNKARELLDYRIKAPGDNDWTLSKETHSSRYKFIYSKTVAKN